MDLETIKREWTEYVLTLASERFERRLAEELGKLRVEIAKTQAELKYELRKEFQEGLAGIRGELQREISSVRVEMANLRADLFRWSFLFWLGQMATMVAMFAYMIRALER